MRPPKYGEKTELPKYTLLVDGNALFKQSFFGAKDLYNENGVHVGGLYQFLTTLRKLIKTYYFHSVYVFWDGNLSGKLRYDLYKPYKSARGKDYVNGTQPIDESELDQREVVWEYLNELYIKQLRHDMIEGDDFIGAYCLMRKPNEKVTIASTDRDMLQLIADDVIVYLLDKKDFVTVKNYNTHFKHFHKNALLIKTMVGDTSDSIKGIKGLGEPKLLSLFPFLTEREVNLSEIISSAKELQQIRINEKKKPMIVLDNIINSVTDGVQGDKIYEINEKIINLKKPLLTNESVNELKDLIDGYFVPEERDTKKIYEWMVRDGLDKIIGEHRYPEFLLPFKKLEERERRILN